MECRGNSGGDHRMKRVHVLSITCIVAAVSIAHAVPARPLYEPPDPPTPVVFTLGGTHWFGTCYAENFWIIFEKQGTINWGYGQLDAKKAGSNGTWKLEGNNLYFEMN